MRSKAKLKEKEKLKKITNKIWEWKKDPDKKESKKPKKIIGNKIFEN